MKDSKNSSVVNNGLFQNHFSSKHNCLPPFYWKNIELVLRCSFTCNFHILPPNFVFFSHRSYGYAAQKSLH